MKNLTKLLGLTATTVFALSSMQVTAQTGNLTNLLDLVRQDRVAESEDYR